MAILLAVAACSGEPGAAASRDAETGPPPLEAAQIAQGKPLYDAYCASCHGIDGTGEENWKVPNADGSYPPPPHDSTGHTWHHSDRLLVDLIANGSDFARSRMPAFGDQLSIGEIEAVLEWAIPKGIHVVFDEIYALSVFGETPFTSVASVLPRLGEHVHVVWAFSKDFGASGLRCGVLVSENDALLRAVDGLSYWGAVSGHTQWLLGRMIEDDAWIDRYRVELRRRLGATYGRVTAALDAARIPYVPAEAGIFVLCDVRRFLDAPTWEAEDALWRRILDEANVNLTPGSACRIGEPGFMRLCYAKEPVERVVEAIERLGRLLV